MPSDPTPSPGLAEPSGSDERSAVLAWAAAFRNRRMELRRALSSGQRSLVEVLAGADDTDDGAVRVLFVLESLPGAGKVATRRHLARLGLDGDLALADLTAVQREVLLAEFPRPAAAT